MIEGNGACFGNVRGQVGFCGIWCGSCVIGNGALRELAHRFGKTIEGYGLREWAPDGFDYESFSRGLEVIGGVPPCPGCLKGGGREDCEIRSCALEKGLEDCLECGDFGACHNAEIIGKMRAGAVAAGLLVKDKGGRREEVLTGWEAQLAERWPCCLLFHDGLSSS